MLDIAQLIQQFFQATGLTKLEWYGGDMVVFNAEGTPFVAEEFKDPSLTRTGLMIIRKILIYHSLSKPYSQEMENECGLISNK